VFDVRANNSGGADFLVAQGSTVAVWQLAGARVRKVGSGPLTQVQLFAGRNGKNLVTGTGPVTAAGLIRVAAPANSHLIAVSLDGRETASQSAGRPRRSQQGPLTLASGGSGQMVTASLPQSATRAATALPGLNLGTPGSGQQPAALAPRRGMAIATTTATPACAVPRNDLWTQVPQPNSAQIRWAVQQAVRGWLVPGNIQARPAAPGDYKIGDSQPLPQFYPNQDFPPPAIAGHPGAVVPPQVIYGILAQESNWNQASWHALAGYGGNPLIANYYGSTNAANPTDIDFPNADCGYGIGQITDGMQTGAANANTQTAIAVDYAENIAAAVTNLVGKWNQLHSLGITMNNDDPSDIENWYAAIWAYNSGVHMVANNDPANGLGWANNPANPVYPANRQPFLRSSTTDAAHPQSWPYQEKVLGWIESSQIDPNDGNNRFPGIGPVLDIPGFKDKPLHSTFCNPTVNNCNPSMVGSTSSCNPGDASCDPCPNENSSCWWDQPVTWADCSSQSSDCHGGSFTITAPTEPEPAPTTIPAECNSGSDLDGNALVVADTALADQNPNDLYPNVVGCNVSAANWTDSGNFELMDSAGAELSLADPASIDLHQIGTGFGGHAWFTHTRPSSDAAHAVIGQWTLNNTASGIYQIQVFVPTPGATTTNATYTVDGTYRRTVNQNNYNNQWVSIGFYPLHPNATVTLTSITAATDSSQGGDIAFAAMAFIPVHSGSYVSLGDSYSSGEGTSGPWDEGTDVLASDGAPADEMCHRSSNGYPRQYAALTQTFKGTAVVHLACSGSTLQDLDNIHWAKGPDGTIYFNPSSPYATPSAPSGSSTSWNGGTLGNGEPGTQVDLLRQIPAPKLVTVSVGINDSGFASILQNCIIRLSCQQFYTNSDGSDQVQKTISGLQGPETQALEDIKAAVPAGTKIVLIIYPVAFNSNSSCTGISLQDVSWLIARGQQLDQMLIAAANSAGISYLNEENAFRGHEICTSDPWINNLPASPSDAMNKHIFNNSFHPTTAGYTQVANDLRNYLGSIP
jgi:hypothetical protein